MQRMVSWQKLYDDIYSCKLCPLCRTRINVVPGEGNYSAKVLFVGEGPGREEDETGRPFVGAAGKLLDKMLAAIDIKREDVYIANIVKCRPPGNRTPEESEAQACLQYLRMQFGLIKPRIIVCLGATPSRYIIGSNVRVTRDHGQWVEKRGILMMPTFHPAALLRDEEKKRLAWNDLKSLRAKIEEIAAHE